jgi:hypothetical protein
MASFSTHNGTLRNAWDIFSFSQRGYNATRRIPFGFFPHNSYVSGCVHPQEEGGTVACALVASACSVYVCPQLTWPAPPSTAGNILLYLEISAIHVLCILLYYYYLSNFNTVVNEYLISYI